MAHFLKNRYKIIYAPSIPAKSTRAMEQLDNLVH